MYKKRKMFVHMNFTEYYSIDVLSIINYIWTICDLSNNTSSIGGHKEYVKKSGKLIHPLDNTWLHV